MRNESSYGNGIFGIIKGVGLALAFSFIGVVAFAVILKESTLPDSSIYPVNQVLKTLAVILGTLVFVRGEKGWLKGGAVALLFTALSYLAFAAIGGDFSLSWLILTELLVSLAAGVLSGILAVNLRN